MPRPYTSPYSTSTWCTSCGDVQAAETNDHRRPAANGAGRAGDAVSLVHERRVAACPNAIARGRIELCGWQAVKQFQQWIGHGVTSSEHGC